MLLTPVTDQREVRTIYDSVTAELRQDTEEYETFIGFKSGRVFAKLYWNPRTGIWSHHSDTQTTNRYWCCYGTKKPERDWNLSISVEVNPPFSGIDARTQGLYLRDVEGNRFLAHRGRPGGGKPGITRDGFRRFCRNGAWEMVEWPGGVRSEVLVISEIGSEHFASHVASFVKEVADYKASVIAGAEPQGKASQGLGHRNAGRLNLDSFSPEFEGTRAPYSIAKAIAAQCDHGTIVNELARLLEREGLRIANDRYCDLVLVEDDVIFEVKTSRDRGSLYTAIGQLLYHRHELGKSAEMFVVLPLGLDETARAIVSKLGIGLLEYEWVEEAVVFPKAAGLVRRLKGK